MDEFRRRSRARAARGRQAPRLLGVRRLLWVGARAAAAGTQPKSLAQVRLVVVVLLFQIVLQLEESCLPMPFVPSMALPFLFSPHDVNSFTISHLLL
jgi:hypothetical protein